MKVLIVKNITREGPWHFELTEEMFNVWINQDPDLLRLSKKGLENDYRKIKSEYGATGSRLLTNFLNIAGLM